MTHSGAQRIYQRIFNTLIAQQLDALHIGFDSFRADPSLGGRLLAWTGLEPDAQQMQAAREWVRSEPSDASASGAPQPSLPG